MNNNKKKIKNKRKMPNEFHRKERWSRGLVQESKKVYRRKEKHKPDYKKY